MLFFFLFVQSFHQTDQIQLDFMTLKNLMEKSQLNFDQPLLSVRRGSLIGTPSEVNKRKTNNSNPKLPTLPYYNSELKSGPVRNPGVVPFQWEQTPGRPKEEKKDPRETTKQLPLAPRLPPGRLVNHKKKLTDNGQNDSLASSSRSHGENNIPCSPGTSSVDKVLSEFEGSEEGKKDDNMLSSDDENVIYEDARDTLSRTESFFFNCSVSGVSGLDGPNMDPSEPLLDPQTRDFMMGRFLPAAKAVASETPQFASRKHPVAREKPKPVKKVVTKQSLRKYDIPNTLPHNIHRELEGEGEEDDVDNFHDAKDLPSKLCGLLPRFCLLNPIPGMRDQAHLISSVQSARTRPPYGGMRNKTVNKHRTDNLGEIKRITCHYTNKSTPTAHFGRNGNAPWKNDLSLSFLRERGFLGLPEVPNDFKAAKIDPDRKPDIKFKALLADLSAEEVISPVNSAIEKTLYVDSEPSIDSLDSNSSSFGSAEMKPSVDYSLQDMKPPFGLDQKGLSQPKSSDTVDASLFSSSDKSSQNDRRETLQVSPRDKNVGLVCDTELSQKSHVKETNRKSGPSLALAPLLPKSPSESWLSRTLSSMSSKHPSSKLCSGNVAFKISHMDPNRDRTLKTSNGQHLFLPPTGELATISEN